MRRQPTSYAAQDSAIPITFCHHKKINDNLGRVVELGLALRLAAEASPTVLLHGDLTPVNVLDGGEAHGLVAIDPAPCGGDLAFDTVDLLIFRAEDVETITSRATRLATAVGADADRLLDWCAAFAGMVALERAEAPGCSREQVEPLLSLASRV